MNKSFYSTIEKVNRNKNLIIRAKINIHEIKYEGSFFKTEYVIYKVNFYTKYKNWEVKKRYSEFELFDQMLRKKYSNLPLKELPPKRLFKSSESTINERKIKLKDYMNFLFENTSICIYEEILDFIEIDTDLISFIVKTNEMIESYSTPELENYLHVNKGKSMEEKKSKSFQNITVGTKENYYKLFLEHKLENDDFDNDLSENMLVIEEFLRNLEYRSDSKSQIVRSFEQFLKIKKEWPNFNNDEIKLLLFGNDDCDSSYISNVSTLSDYSNEYDGKIEGLMHHITKIEENTIGAIACLELLGKLIDYEFNPYSQAYIRFLKSNKVEFFQFLRFKDYVNTKNSKIKNTVFRIVNAMVYHDKIGVKKLKKLINNDEACEKFLNWLKIN